MTIERSRTESWPLALFTLVLVGVIALACGDSTQTADTGGISGTGLSQGTIDSFGSIFVNDVEWDTGAARVELDGTVANENDLRLGMVVTIRGDLDSSGTSGVATSVEFDDDVEGPVDSVPMVIDADGTQKQFTVLGRAVIIDSTETVFDDGADFATIALDDFVEVSGLVDGAGIIRATRLELRGVFPVVTEVELEGVIMSLVQNGDGTGLFDLGPIMVEYDSTTEFSGLNEEDLANGTNVEVKGSLVGGGTDRIDASEIELEDDFEGEDFSEFEVEGIVSNFVSISDFEVAGFQVDASEAEPAGLMITEGDRVEVKGSLTGGILVATEVESEDESSDDVRIDAAISAIDADSRTVTLLGVEVEIGPGAQLEDERDDLPNFGFNDLTIGDWLEMRGAQTGLSTARAIEVDRRFAEDDVQLEGPVTSLDPIAHTIEILGQTIPIDGGTQYFDEFEMSLTEVEFFETPEGVDLGDVVRVRDSDAADDRSLLEADEVEIEVDD